ncbi:hypothetical protein [Cyclobacterium roseum]|uniref:hypothetical protein n=1 Tax=Cyclobacterium roseum TaxID=2666137 RepID=UPI001390AC7F|nr:hypothetical protein [Cyclobacterium roseum]
MFTYKISFEHHFQNSWPILIYLVGAFILPFYITKRFGSGDTWIFIILTATLFLMFFIPQLLVHINYYTRNKADIFFYDPSGQKITINHKGESVSFSFNDIQLIKRFKSYPLAENRMQWFPWDSYNYSVIRLKNGKEFIITSLLVPNMGLPIASGRIRLEKRFYPIVQDT